MKTGGVKYNKASRRRRATGDAKKQARTVKPVRGQLFVDSELRCGGQVAVCVFACGGVAVRAFMVLFPRGTRRLVVQTPSQSLSSCEEPSLTRTREARKIFFLLLFFFFPRASGGDQNACALEHN
jgi:hypothetical protein